jgi:GNAT superfamily N-acetyltransferase
VAGPLAEFARVHTERERVWIVERNDEVAGSIGIVDAHGGAAQLRWFLLDPPLRGKGLGRRLMDEAIAFAMECDYTRVFLWTVSALEADRALGTVGDRAAVRPETELTSRGHVAPTQRPTRSRPVQ